MDISWTAKANFHLSYLLFVYISLCTSLYSHLESSAASEHVMWAGAINKIKSGNNHVDTTWQQSVNFLTPRWHHTGFYYVLLRSGRGGTRDSGLIITSACNYILQFFFYNIHN